MTKLPVPAEEFLLSGLQVVFGLLQQTGIESLEVAVQLIRSTKLDNWKVALVKGAFQRPTRKVQQHMVVPDRVLLNGREQLLKDLLQTEQPLFSNMNRDGAQA